MRYLLIILGFTFFSLKSYSQNEWDTWDKNYSEINMPEMIKYEKAYADSVEKGLIKGDYYLRLDKYRFPAHFTGGKRVISESIKASILRVYGIHGNKANLPKLKEITYEYQFEIGDELYWLSIQPILEKPFEEEIKKGEEVYLYCLYLNEHVIKGQLYNSFIISEFIK